MHRHYYIWLSRLCAIGSHYESIHKLADHDNHEFSPLRHYKNNRLWYCAGPDRSFLTSKQSLNRFQLRQRRCASHLMVSTYWIPDCLHGNGLLQWSSQSAVVRMWHNSSFYIFINITLDKSLDFPHAILNKPSVRAKWPQAIFDSSWHHSNL